MAASAALAALVIRAAGAGRVADRLAFAAGLIFTAEFAAGALIAAGAHLLALAGVPAAGAVALTVLALFDDDGFLLSGFGKG